MTAVCLRLAENLKHCIQISARLGSEARFLRKRVQALGYTKSTNYICNLILICMPAYRQKP